MMRPASAATGTDGLTHRAVFPGQLTDRQRQVVELVNAYVAVAHEPPSAGWIARRLSISRERARQHLEAIRQKTP